MSINAFNNSQFLNNPNEIIKQTQNSYGITDTLTNEKVCFAFFLDKFSSELGKKDSRIEKLTSLEWYAGSLSRQFLVSSLQKFLGSTISAKLDSATLQALEQFIQLQGQDIAYDVDLARKDDLRLVMNIKTGNKIFLALPAMHISESKADQLADKTINQLKKMAPGQSTLFLTGNLYHETQMLVTFTQEKEWKIRCYDSAITEKIRITLFKTNETILFNKNAWKTIYQSKLSESALHFVYYVILGENAKADHADISHSTVMQRKNTCHTKGLLAVLKDFVFSAYSEHSNLPALQWKT